MTRRALGQPAGTVFSLVSLYSLVRGLEGQPLLHRSACGAGCFAGPDGKGGWGGGGGAGARTQGPRERRESTAGRQTALGESNRAIEGGE